MKQLLFAAAFWTLLICAGCATKWELRTEQSDINLQWPYQPEPAKANFVMTMKGFKQKSAAQTALKTIVYGEGNGEHAFVLPVAVAKGRDGRIAVADTGCKCVHLYIPDDERYIQLQTANSEALRSPVSVIFDDELKLYVSDSAAGMVFLFDKNGKFMSSLQIKDGDSFKRPTGLAYNSHRKLLYVADTLGNRVYAFNSNGEISFSFGGRGDDKGLFNFPTHLFWSPEGILYVTDSMNFRIQMFDDSGHFLGSFGSHGDGSGNFAMPKGVAADKDGIVYVVDNLFDNIQLFSIKGKFLLTLGARGTDFGKFWLPSGMFIDDSGILYLCDTYNRRIQVFLINKDYVKEKF